MNLSKRAPSWSLAVSFYLLCDDAEIKGQEVEQQFVSTRPPDLQEAGGGDAHVSPTVTGNIIQPGSTAAPQPAKIPPSESSEKFNMQVLVKCFIFLFFFCANQFILWICQAVVEI